jgi:L-amino acid N-acyltransferase YncA
VRIDDLQPSDWPDAARIFADGLDLGTFEETVPTWEEFDERYLAEPRLLAREGEALGWEALGWAALAPVSRRSCYRGVAENSVYVAVAARGRGVGRALLEELVRRSESAGIWTIQAHMFADNAASRALHEACGFRLVGIRERLARKHGAWRDTALLERRSAFLD